MALLTIAAGACSPHVPLHQRQQPPTPQHLEGTLATAINRFLDPIRERRASFEDQPGLVDQIIVEGTERTRREVQQVVVEVRKAMGLAGAYNQLRRKAERAQKKATGQS